MKFGKSYMETIASPSFPEEWRRGAIEYKHLKKLINGVVAELESLGLGTDVLRELLRPELCTAGGDESSADEEAPAGGEEMQGAVKAAANDIGSDVFPPKAVPKSNSHETLSPPLAGAATLHMRRKDSKAANWLESVPRKTCSSLRTTSGKDRSSSSGSVHEFRGQLEQPAHDSHFLDGSEESDNVEILSPPSNADFQAASRRRSSGMGKKDLHRLYKRMGGSSAEEVFHSGHASESGGEQSPAPHSSSHTNSGEGSGRHDWGAHAWRERGGSNLWKGSDEDGGPGPSAAECSPSPSAATGRRPVCQESPQGPDHQRWVQGKGGRRARAEYELGGSPEHPMPRIRLHIESPVTSDDDYDGDRDDDAGNDDTGPGLPIIQELPPSPEVRAKPSSRRASAIASCLPPLDAASNFQVAGSDPTGIAADRTPSIEHRPRRVRPSYRRMRKREILIPLNADTEFLDTLTGALSNLQIVQNEQRDHFIADTEDLTATIARASSPYASKNDLYVWREIFSLWMEMQIFESEREKDRGELSVDESEARLKRFADELAKRGWGPGDLSATQRSRSSKRLVKRKNASAVPMHEPQSIQALEDFMKLNIALLDVKKFQRINVEAARKILKKHDKRTALTASEDLRAFIARQQDVQASFSVAAAASIPDISPNFRNLSQDVGNGSSRTLITTHPSLAALLPSSTTGMLSKSLPHILLSLLSTTLLPILPSIDDYSCVICTGVAWRPIRLDCTHLFCIRCLVKLQKQGKRDCPLCRAKNVVGIAGAQNLDLATTNMLKTWFPREVDEKDKENERERRKEEMRELGLEGDKCSVM